jgi:hypothetical protein
MLKVQSVEPFCIRELAPVAGALSAFNTRHEDLAHKLWWDGCEPNSGRKNHQKALEESKLRQICCNRRNTKASHAFDFVSHAIQKVLVHHTAVEGEVLQNWSGLVTLKQSTDASSLMGSGLEPRARHPPTAK